MSLFKLMKYAHIYFIELYQDNLTSLVYFIPKRFFLASEYFYIYFEIFYKDFLRNIFKFLQKLITYKVLFLFFTTFFTVLT